MSQQHWPSRTKSFTIILRQRVKVTRIIIARNDRVTIAFIVTATTTLGTLTWNYSLAATRRRVELELVSEVI